MTAHPTVSGSLYAGEMASYPKRPETPEYLAKAVYRIFGERCLRCGTDRPLEVAHIRNWPTCTSLVEKKTEGLRPPPTWHQTAEEWRYQDAYGLFHDLGNVLPLCASCHALFDGARYDDVTEEQIRKVRDDAVLQPEILMRTIDFVGAELRGRPNRCTHKEDNGRRRHTHRSDVMAITAPLSWLQRGFTLGLDLGDPALIVASVDGLQHHHVALDHSALSLCLGDLRDCTRATRLWKDRQPSAPRS